MYECPNCAGNLQFNIELQKLYCKHCNTQMDPYAFQKDEDAKESDVFEVTTFLCPQCGGELLTEDTTAATFCSYCDGATILDSRISKEKRPSFIIPFQKTKDDCKQSFQKMMRRAYFAPKALKDLEHIEKFRGIYMPYWISSFHKHGTGYFTGEKAQAVYNKDKKQQVAHYRIQTNIDADYEDFVFDASSTFNDNLSAAVGPFDFSEKKPFTPSYLSGFYADSYDVEGEAYYQEASDIIKGSMEKALEKEKFWFPYQCHKAFETDNLMETMAPWEIENELAMLPVWFLSYRKDDRVAYAVVNGQTGEAAADLPIDGSLILKGSLLLTIPIFLLLNMLFTFTPSTLLKICVLLGAVFLVIAHNMTTDTLLKESYTDTKIRRAQWSEAKRSKDKLFSVIVCAVYIGISLPFLLGWLALLLIYGYYSIVYLLAMFGFIVYIVQDLHALRKIKKEVAVNSETYQIYWKKKAITMAKPFASILLSFLVIFINPIADEYYYITAMISIGLILWCIKDIIHCHNLLCTRKLPQLNKRGGDHLE